MIYVKVTLKVDTDEKELHYWSWRKQHWSRQDAKIDVPRK